MYLFKLQNCNTSSSDVEDMKSHLDKVNTEAALPRTFYCTEMCEKSKSTTFSFHENPPRQRSMLTQHSNILLLNTTSSSVDIEDMKTHQVQDRYWPNAITFAPTLGQRERGTNFNTDATIQYLISAKDAELFPFYFVEICVLKFIQSVFNICCFLIWLPNHLQLR